MGSYSGWHRGSGLWVVLLCLLATAPVESAEITLQPYISVSQEYNDNIFLARNNKADDFITRISPGVSLDYKAPLWDWRVNAGAEYLYFAKKTQTSRIVPVVSAVGTTQLIDNFLFLDISDYYTRVPLNTGYQGLYANQSNQNFLTVSPYFKFHPLTRLGITTGYAYKNMSYDHPGTIDWQEHDLFLRATHELTPRSNYYLNLTYADTTTSNNVNYSRFTPSVGFDYTYADSSRINLEGGYSILFLDDGRTKTSPYWTVGINYKWGAMVASLDGGVTYNTDPYRNITERRSIRGTLARDFPRGTLGLSPYYGSTKEYLAGSDFQTSYGVSAFGTYHFSERVEGNVNLTGGRERGTTFVEGFPGIIRYDTPYNLVMLSWGLNYAFNYDLSLFFNCISTSYLYDSASNVYNNRAIIGMKKTFQGWSF